MGAVFNEGACREQLRQGAKRLALSLEADQERRLLQLVALLTKWNRAFNLTAVRDPLEMVSRHLLDSLAVLPYLTGKRCLDMGTGPGLPGIPLAIMRPDMAFVLLDSNGKKIRFVRQAVMELALENVAPVHARVESYEPDDSFDLLIARAFTALPDMLKLTRHLRGEKGVLLAMKAKLPVAELTDFKEGEAFRVIPLPPGLHQEERCLIRFPAAS
jgi:16S rRNA (guanine527-N7)-methyltransferase